MLSGAKDELCTAGEFSELLAGHCLPHRSSDQGPVLISTLRSAFVDDVMMDNASYKMRGN